VSSAPRPEVIAPTRSLERARAVEGAFPMNVMRAVTAAVSVVWSLIGLALAGVAEQAPASAGPDRGMLAVLRRDGMLVPFAAFKGNDWSTPWPVDLQYKELPINLESVPAEWWGGRAPTGWHVRLITGADQPIKVMAPAPYTAHCAPRLGLRSDYRPSEPIRRGQSDPFPKDGLAATDGVPIDPIEIIDRSSPEAAQLVTALAADFNRAEDRMASDLRAATRWKHPFDKEVREKTTVRIEAWYRSPMLEPGYSVSYIEAVRTYPIQPEDDGCPLETTFSGWIEHNAREATRMMHVRVPSQCVPLRRVLTEAATLQPRGSVSGSA